jgi:cytochrome P450
VFTDLAVGLVGGAPLSEVEALGFGVNLLLAGRDATVDGLTTALVHLARVPADQERLRADPSLLARAVEELLRAYTPIGNLGRVTTRDVELDGTVIPAGTSVAVFYGSANRDPHAFEAPEQVRLDRRANRHVAFGHGVHRCIGSQVARLVLRVGIGAALDRPPFALDPASPLQDKPNGDTRGFLAAHLVTR